MDDATDILDIISTRKARGEPFALATVVRTVAATAAKAGAKAVILPDGSMSEGWIGGGCARAAVLKAAHEALADGKSRLVSVQPPDALQDQGVASGDERAGVHFAKNMCPSQGTMDVFVEPVLPAPQLVVCGSSPVAAAIAALGRRLGFTVTVCAAFERYLTTLPAHRSLATNIKDIVLRKGVGIGSAGLPLPPKSAPTVTGWMTKSLSGLSVSSARFSRSVYGSLFEGHTSTRPFGFVRTTQAWGSR